MINQSDMQVFTRIVANKSMTIAARELGISPAVISKRLKKMENRLKTRLLQRTTRQLSLTEAGLGYYERIIPILARIEEAEAFVSRCSSHPSGKLKIAAPSSFGKKHIAPHLTKFMNTNPKLAIELILDDEAFDVISGGYDIVIKIGTLNNSSLITRKLAKERCFLCASPQYLAQFGVPKVFSELQNHTFLCASDETEVCLSDPSGSTVITPSNQFKTNSNEALKEAVLSGAGIALQPTWQSGPEIKDGKLQIILPEYSGTADSNIYALFSSRSFLPAKIRNFIDYLANLYNPNPYWENGIT